MTEVVTEIFLSLFGGFGVDIIICDTVYLV